MVAVEEEEEEVVAEVAEAVVEEEEVVVEVEVSWVDLIPLILLFPFSKNYC